MSGSWLRRWRKWREKRRSWTRRSPRKFSSPPAIQTLMNRKYTGTRIKRQANLHISRLIRRTYGVATRTDFYRFETYGVATRTDFYRFRFWRNLTIGTRNFTKFTIFFAANICEISQNICYFAKSMYCTTNYELLVWNVMQC